MVLLLQGRGQVRARADCFCVLSRPCGGTLDIIGMEHVYFWMMFYVMLMVLIFVTEIRSGDEPFHPHFK